MWKFNYTQAGNSITQFYMKIGSSWLDIFSCIITNQLLGTFGCRSLLINSPLSYKYLQADNRAELESNLFHTAPNDSAATGDTARLSTLRILIKQDFHTFMRSYRFVMR